MGRYAVLDFETTDLSTNNGARVIEIGIVITGNGKTVDKHSNLIKSVWAEDSKNCREGFHKKPTGHDLECLDFRLRGSRHIYGL